MRDKQLNVTVTMVKILQRHGVAASDGYRPHSFERGCITVLCETLQFWWAFFLGPPTRDAFKICEDTEKFRSTTAVLVYVLEKHGSGRAVPFEMKGFVDSWLWRGVSSRC